MMACIKDKIQRASCGTEFITLDPAPNAENRSRETYL